ncbi:glycoside hydrolase family 71 protein [Streptomyces sp. CC228A]|uniref:glycoside hydrolase family 71 protein n=1 Tax=Streptomyces sp. CC228A TaxID=2898186 RepID=UPI001F191A62|nr:glycoside hydrolase family 71 protein [Streptomyces sp. CC228A]
MFAHYFTPYPLSLDNADPRSDYYARNYLNPTGERGKHSEYGGLLRDRPLPVEPKEGDWELANLRQEVRTARDAGLDGFTLDILSLSGPNWERSQKLLEAARSVDSRFTVMLMPDMSSLRSVDAATLADAVAELAESPAAHRLGDGRLVVSPFKAEARSVAWWSDVLDRLRDRHGIRTAFVPLFIDFGSQGEAFAPISYGFSDWGSRSYTGQDGPSGDARRAHALGKIWMQPVSVQDARPNQGVYDEAGNTAALRATWDRAIDSGADWVQLTTWNDYSEGTHFAPSVNNGHTYLDLTSYYLTRFKTGSWPKIVRDTLYLTSRTQFADADPTGDQSKVMKLRESSAEARDQVEVLAFLTAPATVRTTVGSTTTSRDLKAGVHPALSPLRVGAVSAEAVRDGRRIASAQLREPVRGSVEVQDLQYHAATSGR